MPKNMEYDRILHGSIAFSYRYPRFSKVHFTPPCFYKRPKLAPIFINNDKHAKRIFTFTKKVKSENRFSICFGREPSTEAVRTPVSGTSKLLPQELYSASSCHSFKLFL